MQKIDGPRSKPLGVPACQIGRPPDYRVELQRNVQQGAPGKEAFEPVKRGVPLARNLLPRARWQRPAFVKCALQDRIPNLQGMQRKEEQPRQADTAILPNGCPRIRFRSNQSKDKAAVGVGPHRRESSSRRAALILDGVSRRTSSRISAVARRRSASTSAELAG